MNLTIVIYLVLFCVVLIYKLWPRKRTGFVVEQDVEDLTTNVLANIDGDDLVEEEEEREFFDPKRNKGRFLAKVVVFAKAKFGKTSRTEANRLMVRKFLYDLMCERGMRNAHIAQHLDVCVALFFVPSNAQIKAEQVASTREAVSRSILASASWESFYGLFGAKRDDSQE
jgi:hypothetical protein